LHFFWYNFVRVHDSLDTTPAVKAGVADHVWSYEEMVVAALKEMGQTQPPPPAKRYPSTYKRRRHVIGIVEPAAPCP
jgi:hypothetical protein